MTQTATVSPRESTDTAYGFADSFAKLRATFESGRTRDLAWREAELTALAVEDATGAHVLRLHKPWFRWTIEVSVANPLRVTLMARSLRWVIRFSVGRWATRSAPRPSGRTTR